MASLIMIFILNIGHYANSNYSTSKCLCNAGAFF
jgi:hypothetical protein